MIVHCVLPLTSPLCDEHQRWSPTPAPPVPETACSPNPCEWPVITYQLILRDGLFV